MVNPNQYINTNYPQNERNKVDVLHLANQNREGVLDLRDFTNLVILNCSNNQLTDILLPKTNTLIDITLFPNPFTNPKEKLMESWEVYKNIPQKYGSSNDKFGHLLPQTMKLIDTSDLDNWVANYDFSQQGNQEYHKIMGQKFKGWNHLDEDYAEYPSSAIEVNQTGQSVLSKMGQQVLARCFIQMNRLLHGIEHEWETKINKLATNFSRQTVQKEFGEHVKEAEVEKLEQLLEVKVRELQAEVVVKGK